MNKLERNVSMSKTKSYMLFAKLRKWSSSHNPITTKKR